jgi:hypothetical protein
VILQMFQVVHLAQYERSDRPTSLTVSENARETVTNDCKAKRSGKFEPGHSKALERIVVNIHASKTKELSIKHSPFRFFHHRKIYYD